MAQAETDVLMAGWAIDGRLSGAPDQGPDGDDSVGSTSKRRRSVR